jgi:hypothetical protein
MAGDSGGVLGRSAAEGEGGALTFERNSARRSTVILSVANDGGNRNAYFACSYEPSGRFPCADQWPSSHQRPHSARVRPPEGHRSAHGRGPCQRPVRHPDAEETAFRYGCQLRGEATGERACSHRPRRAWGSDNRTATRVPWQTQHRGRERCRFRGWERWGSRT